MATTKKTKTPAKRPATKKAPAKASGDKPKFGSPEWQAKYGRGKKAK